MARAKTEPQALEARQRASALDTRRTLLKALAGAHKTKDGTLYACPLCNGARQLLVQTDKSDDPNYLYTFKQLCGCDHQQLTTNLGVRSSNLFGRASKSGTSHASPYLSWEPNKVNKVLAAELRFIH
jgi:hypothetical protein